MAVTLSLTWATGLNMDKRQAVNDAIAILEKGFREWAARLNLNNGDAHRPHSAWLSQDDIEALRDGEQWPALLADWRDRIGVPVSAINAARDSLLWYYEEAAEDIIEQCDTLNAQIDALPDTDRDGYATLSGKLEDLETALFALNDMRNDSLNEGQQ